MEAQDLTACLFSNLAAIQYRIILSSSVGSILKFGAYAMAFWLSANFYGVWICSANWGVVSGNGYEWATIIQLRNASTVPAYQVLLKLNWLSTVLNFQKNLLKSDLISQIFWAFGTLGSH